MKKFKVIEKSRFANTEMTDIKGGAIGTGTCQTAVQTYTSCSPGGLAYNPWTYCYAEYGPSCSGYVTTGNPPADLLG